MKEKPPNKQGAIA